MNTYIFTDEEREFLKENIEDIIYIFANTHIGLQNKYKDISFFQIHKLFNNYISYKKFMAKPKKAYINGYCLTFAKIMKMVIPDFELVGLDTHNHILIKYEEYHFDIRGFLEKGRYKSYTDRVNFVDIDSSHYNRIEKYFKQLPDEIFIELMENFYKNLKEYLNTAMSFENYINSKHN